MSRELASLVDELDQDNEIRDVAHVSVIEFSGTARVATPLTRVSDTPEIGRLSKGTWTNYVDVWKLLSELVQRDCEKLRSARYRIRRPTIFFITDGNPGSVSGDQTKDDWGPYVDKLASSLGPIAPRIIAVGIGSVKSTVLLDLHSKDPHGAAVVAPESGQASQLVQPLISQIRDSIRNSALRGSFFWRTPAGMRNLCEKARH